MKQWKLLLFATALCIAPVLAACGDDDDNGNNPGDGGPGTDSPIDNPDGEGPGDGGGMDGGDGSINTTSFPAYVKSLIEVKTTATGVPDTEAVWGAIPDDDKFVFPTTFFP